MHGKYEFNKNSSNISFSSLNKLIRSQTLIDDIVDDRKQETIEETEGEFLNVPFSGDGQLTPNWQHFP